MFTLLTSPKIELGDVPRDKCRHRRHHSGLSRGGGDIKMNHILDTAVRKSDKSKMFFMKQNSSYIYTALITQLITDSFRYICE